MSSEPKVEDVAKAAADGAQEASSVASSGWLGKIEEQYRKTKEHAETYPYVWGSYLLVYGGFGLWLTYRWRRLRGTEDRVRALQERLRKLVDAEQQQSAANSASAVANKEKSVNSASLTTNKPSPPSPGDEATK